VKPKLPRLRLLGKVAGLSIYLVSGERIRDEIDIDFTMGGNEAVYSYVPTGEIWLDDAMHVLDRSATALHELVERDLMLHHGMDYDRAHDAASARERAFRKELAHQPPRTFDARRVGVAYRAHLREQSPREHARLLDREIDEALSRST
jgi:hypothetical protein